VSDSSSYSRAGWRGVLLIVMLLSALGLRLGWAVTRPVSDAALEGLPDQLQYLQIARNVAAGNGYWFIDKRLAERVYAFRTPGYPLLLAACRANVRAMLVLQAVLDTGTVLGVYVLALLVFPADEENRGDRQRRTLALLAAAMIAFSPFFIYFCGLLLSETVFVAMLVWGMVLLLAGNGASGGRPRTIFWLAGGALLAMSVLVRPSAMLFPIVLGVAAPFVNRRPERAYQREPAARGLRWPLPVGTTMLLLTLLAIAPWALRNHGIFKQWVLLDTNTGFTLYDGYNPDATGASNQRFVDYLPQLRSMGEVERSKYLQNRALDYARDNPRRVLDLAAAKLVRTWSPVPLSEQYSQRSYQLIGLLYSLPLDLLVLWGLVAGNLSRSAKVFLLLPAIYLSGIHMLTVGSLRYRLPAEPALAVLAASALVSSGSRRSNPKDSELT
jgi:hypothetical protein